MKITTNYTPMSIAIPMKNEPEQNPNFKGKEKIVENIKPQTAKNTVKKAGKIGFGMAAFVALFFSLGEAVYRSFGMEGPVTQEVEYQIAKYNLKKRGMSIPGEKGSNDIENILYSLENFNYGGDPKMATRRKWEDVKFWEELTKN